MDIHPRKLLTQPLYALPEPQLSRTHPMQDLTPGLTRCGTEVLQTSAP